MKLNRKHIRKLILQEMTKTGPMPSVLAPPNIIQKAQQIGSGYIIDISAMEAAAGGYYPGYVVENGQGLLDKEHIDTFEEYIYILGDYGKDNVHIYPSQEDYAANFDRPAFSPLQNKSEDDNPVGGLGSKDESYLDQIARGDFGDKN